MKLFTDSNCEISPSGYIRVEDFEKMSFERFLKKWDYDLHRESDKNDGNSGNYDSMLKLKQIFKWNLIYYLQICHRNREQ